MQSDNLDLKQLKEAVEIMMRNHGRSKRWNQLLLRIDEAS